MASKSAAEEKRTPLEQRRVDQGKNTKETFKKY
jgi:hypothetical protein